MTVNNNGTGHITADGTLADINAALNGLHYTATDTPNASVTLTVQANDNGNVGTVQPASTNTTATVTLNIAAQDDAPSNLLNGSALPATGTHVVAIPNTGQANPATVFANLGSTFSVSDPDAGSTSMTTTVTRAGATIGTLDATAGGGSNITGHNSASLTITGSQTDISKALATLALTPPQGSVAAETMTIVTNDNASPTTGGPL